MRLSAPLDSRKRRKQQPDKSNQNPLGKPMKKPVCEGDPTSHGGVVKTASSSFNLNGRKTETAGTSKNFEFTGRWALIRMLERAKVEPIDNATFQLTWQATPDTSMARTAAQSVPGASNARTLPHTAADDWSGSADDASPGHASLDSLVTQAPLTTAPANLTYPLSYFMRADVGKGPLELLALKGFKMPNRMFIDNKRVVPKSKGASPPPLPKAAREAAKQAATPLPSGDPGHLL
jgi:type VI secretion system protein ImpL